MMNLKTMATLARFSFGLGIVAIFISVLFAGVYFVSKELWMSAGQPSPGNTPEVDFWGQWKNITSSNNGTAYSYTIPVGGMVALGTPFFVISMLCAIAALILGYIAFDRTEQLKDIIGMLLGVVAVALSIFMLLAFYIML
jgi:hypothetical protein